jgi:DNA-binding FadR family transcriptional regulator
MSTDLGQARGRAGRIKPQITQPAIADMVAATLRERIVSGELPEGTLLPRQDELVAEFKVSRAPLREALRILEAEGLIVVRRGSRGGAVVYSPNRSGTAQSMGQLLQFHRVTLGDLGDAISEIEPLCVAMAAAREDRNDTLVPQLLSLIAEQEATIGDSVAFTAVCRRFHEALVNGCGNTTLALTAGALSGLWSVQECEWADVAAASSHYPVVEERNLVIRTHQMIVDCIVAGERSGAAALARTHAIASQSRVLNGRRDLPVNGMASVPPAQIGQSAAAQQ